MSRKRTLQRKKRPKEEVDATARANNHARALRGHEAELLAMQRSHGNRYVATLIGHGATVQLQEEREDEGVAPLPPAVADMAFEDELQGHGSTAPPGLVQRWPPGAGALAPPAPAPSPTANITLTANPPTIVRKPEADISTDHGQPNTAGWCTPTYNIQVTGGNTMNLNISVTLGFTIELASEYTGGRLTVLQDHEMGHVIIGKRVAQEHLVDGMRSSLQALPDFTSRASVRAAMQGAVSSFVTEEGTQSQAYDTADYPRMREAYLGVRTPLAELAEGSTGVSQMVEELDNFSLFAETIMSSSEEGRPFIEYMDRLRSARMALSETDLARLQYNPEFKAKVQHASAQVQTLKAASDEEDRVALDEIEFVLNSFTWTAAP